MSKKTVTVCDGCKKAMESISQIYKLKLETDSFWDGIERSECIIELDFCVRCALQIKESLKKIANSLEAKKNE